MILHILRKDWTLLWPVVVLVAALRALAEWAVYGPGLFGDELPWAMGSDLLGNAAAVGWVVLVAAVVHQEPLSGTREDWLIRPIARWQLLCAKLLFLALMVHAPIVLVGFVGAMASGFPPGASFMASVARAGSNFAVYTLAMFALASVTRNLTQLLVSGAGLVLLVSAAQLVWGGLSGDWDGTVSGSGYAWTGEFARALLVCLCAMIVIGLQYFRRGAIAWSYAVVILGTVLPVGLAYLPWDVTLAAQQSVSRGAPAARVTLEADTSGRAAESEGRARLISATSPTVDEDATAGAIRAARRRLAGVGPDELALQGVPHAEDEDASIAVPLVVSGLAPGAILWADRADARLIDAGGREVFSGAAEELQIRGAPGVTEARQILRVPLHVYAEHAHRDLRLEIDYTFTLLTRDLSAVLRPNGGETMLPDGMNCGTRLVREMRPAVRFRCLTVAKPPSCFSVALLNNAGTRRAPELAVCNPDYAPYRRGSHLFRRFGIDIPLSHVGPEYARRSILEDRVLSFVTYEARAHFTRRLVIPALRPGEWRGR